MRDGRYSTGEYDRSGRPVTRLRVNTLQREYIIHQLYAIAPPAAFGGVPAVSSQPRRDAPACHELTDLDDTERRHAPRPSPVGILAAAAQAWFVHERPNEVINGV